MLGVKKTTAAIVRIAGMLSILGLQGMALGADTKLEPKNAKRDNVWVSDMGGYIIHTEEAVSKIVRGTNVSAKMTWKFSGPSGNYKVEMTNILHYPCQEDVYLKIGSFKKNITLPYPKSGKCCAPKGSGCRSSAKNDFKAFDLGTTKINNGDEIEYGGTTCCCWDDGKTGNPNSAHGSYAGIVDVVVSSSGSTGLNANSPDKNFVFNGDNLVSTEVFDGNKVLYKSKDNNGVLHSHRSDGTRISNSQK